MGNMEVQVVGKTVEIVTDVDSVLEVRRMIDSLRDEIYHRRNELGAEFGWLWDACTRLLARQERPVRVVETDGETA